MREDRPAPSTFSGSRNGSDHPRIRRIRCHIRVFFTHIQGKESGSSLGVGKNRKPEECGGVLLDLGQVLSYSRDTFPHRLGGTSDSCLNRDPVSHVTPALLSRSPTYAPAASAGLRSCACGYWKHPQRQDWSRRADPAELEPHVSRFRTPLL